MTALYTIGFGLIAVSFVMAVIRFSLGPTVPDRVVAVDLITSLFMASVCYFIVHTGQVVYLDALMVLVLISFIGTVAYPYYLQKVGKSEKRGAKCK